MIERAAAWGPQLRSLLRIVTALLFIEHGTAKLFSFPAPQPGVESFQLVSLLGAAAVMEVVGGALVLVGLFTRPVALLLSGEMALGYFMIHAPKSFWPLLNGGEAAILYCFVFLYFAFAGPGPWSLDHRMGRVAR
jgi:putative oxidoreductase